MAVVGPSLVLTAVMSHSQDQIPKPWDYPDEWIFPEQLQPQQGQVQESQVDPQQCQIQESQEGPQQGCPTEEEVIAKAIAGAKAAMEELKTKNGKPRPTVCKLCGEDYWGQIGRSSHYRNRHAKECQICKKIFSMKQHLKAHMLYAHSANPPMHKCEQCGRAFRQKQHLTRHTEELHKGRFFECEYCKTTFTREDKLDIHLKKCAMKSVRRRS